MKNILIFNSERFNIIPNKFWNNLIFFIKKNKPIWSNLLECNSLTINKIILDNKIDVIFFPRGYGVEYLDTFNHKNILKISQMDDLHYRDESTRQKLHRIFMKSDIILLPYYEHFLRIDEFKKYKNKVCLFPFAITDDILSIPKQLKKEKILLSGRTSKSYSFRREILNYSVFNNQIEILEHPGYNDLSHQIVGKEYYNYISKYFANIVTSADKPLDYPVAKYFEISALDTIPIFEKISSLNILGFKENIHFININKKNYKSILNLNFLKEFTFIKDNANNLINENHLITNRVNLFYKIIIKENPINWSLKDVKNK